MRLHRGGTVRAQFDEEYQQKTQRRRCLSEALGELHVQGHYQGLVDRLLELVDGVDEEERRCLRLVATSLVAAVVTGSAGLAVERRQGTESVAGQLDEILETARRIAEEPGLFDGLDGDDIAAKFIEMSQREGISGRLAGSRDDNTPLVVENGGLYIHKMAAYEHRIAEELSGLLDGDVVDSGALGDAIYEVLETIQFELDDAAVERKAKQLQQIADGRFGVVTGGAGSGKTTLVFSVLRALDLLDEESGGIDVADIALCAPTGKAAQRLGESIDEQLDELGDEQGDRVGDQLQRFRDELEAPKTMHRLLKYSPYFDEFRRNADNPIDARLVVVDEASMVGIEMMEALIAALDDDARLILVGDAGQLPSVEGGAVFHDLTDADSLGAELDACLCTLTENHRVKSDPDSNAGDIVEVAHEIREHRATVDNCSDSGDLRMSRDWSEDESGVFFVDFDEEEADIRWFVDQWSDTYLSAMMSSDADANPRLTSRAFFDHGDDGTFVEEVQRELDEVFADIANAQILTLTRVGARGSRAVNRRFHDQYMAARGGARDYEKFLPGEPVMVTQNDYDTGVFNGDQGVILYTRKPWERPDENSSDDTDKNDERAKKRLVVADGENYRAIPLDRVRDKIVHAYALTVHKSQGSEYGHVSIILPELVVQPGADEDDDDGDKVVHPMVTSQLLYTALTRAKESVTVFGDRRVFDEGSTRREYRFSGLTNRIERRR